MGLDNQLEQLVNNEVRIKQQLLTFQNSTKEERLIYDRQNNKKNIVKTWIKHLEKELRENNNKIIATIKKIERVKKASVIGETKMLSIQRSMERTAAVTEEYRKGVISKINSENNVLIEQAKELEKLERAKDEAIAVQNAKKQNLKKIKKARKVAEYENHLASLSPDEKSSFLLTRFIKRNVFGLTSFGVGYMAYQFLINNVNIPLRVLGYLQEWLSFTVIPFLVASGVSVGVFIASLAVIMGVANLLGFLNIRTIKKDIQHEKKKISQKFEDFKQEVHRDDSRPVFDMGGM